MPPLAEGSVQAWWADLARAPAEAARLLSADERARAERFVFDRDRHRWMGGRATLRVLLGRYLGLDPRCVSLAVGENGKLSVPGAAISFNLSHSGDVALYAVAAGLPVGVDVEVHRREVDAVGVARHALGEAEASRLARLPEPERHQEFLRSWVRHEAALKCRASRLGERVELEGLSVVDLDVPGPAAAALAVAGALTELSVDRFEWDAAPFSPTSAG